MQPLLNNCTSYIEHFFIAFRIPSNRLSIVRSLQSLPVHFVINYSTGKKRGNNASSLLWTSVSLVVRKNSHTRFFIPFISSILFHSFIYSRSPCPSLVLVTKKSQRISDPPWEPSKYNREMVVKLEKQNDEKPHWEKCDVNWCISVM